MKNKKIKENKSTVISKKKERIKKINPEIVKILNTPSNSFCERCQNSDMRVIKDSMNLAIQTLHILATALDIQYDDLATLSTKIRRWANHQLHIRRSLLLRAEDGKKKKKAKTN